MKIGVFGLGYVGCVSMACLADADHHVVGVDVNTSKVSLINAGSPGIVEEGLDPLMRKGWESGRIRATDDPEVALKDADVSMICVGTPGDKNGKLDLSSVYAVAGNIGQALAHNGNFHVIMMRSTVLPGTSEKVGNIVEERSGRRGGEDFEVVSNPEFMREGTAVQDFYNPPVTVIGTSCERAYEMVKSVYR
ncbi:MAG TPA: UDP-glucose/GDP-mannose dehydrogenase family protein, partial [Phycisphaerales bacterium]|nr:UDP-glucose/GDP-mannose dehydrogenase family protein [Phycisphaerales bacterium]